MTSDADLEELLRPLCEVLRSDRHLRLVARPGWVVVDRPEGSSAVEVTWDAERHAQVCAALLAPAELEAGHTVAVVGGDTLVLRRAPDPLRGIEDLARDERLSPLAARLLAASLTLGRNVLVAGPWNTGVELVAALLATGQRPALVGRPGDASPPTWPLLSVEDALAYGADRLGTWSLPPSELATLCAQKSGVVAWIDALRLDRALVRFETGIETSVPGASTPLHVLAGVDLVVVISQAGQPRVREIAEVCIAEEGYRPRLLFASNLPPIPSALVPVDVPSFVDDLVLAGHSVLAKELRAVGNRNESSDAGRSAIAPVETVARESPVRESVRRPVIEPLVTQPPRIDPTLVDAAPPGWELDRTGDDNLASETVSSTSEDAALAASFGLGPPPPPPGSAPLAVEIATDLEGATFEDAMKRAQKRDQVLNNEDDES